MKRLLKMILIGFTFGVTVLMSTYLGIYYFAGQEIFAQEIANLGYIENFQGQLITVGLCGSLIALATFFIEKIRNSEKQSGYKAMLICNTVVIIEFIILMLLINARKYEYISNIIVIIEIVVIGIYLLGINGRELIDEIRINKKIKEINKDIKS